MKPRRTPSAIRDTLASILILALAVPPAPAETYTWNKMAAGTYDWNTAANWTASPAGFPNAPGDVANVTGNATGTVTNRLNQATVTVGVVTLGDSDTATRRSFLITTNAPVQTLVFDNGTAPAQLIQLANSNGDRIEALVDIADSLTVASATTDRTLYINGTISGGPGGSGTALSKTGTGEVLLGAANTFEGGVAVQAGRLIGQAQTSGSPFGHSANSIGIGSTDPLVASFPPTLMVAGLVSATTTQVGDIAAGGSFNSGNIALTAAAGGDVTLNGVNLGRDAGATLVVAPRNATSLAASEKLAFSGTGTSLSSGILPPWLVIALNNGDFASYGANGVARATYGSTGFDPLLTDQVVNLTGAASLAAPQTAYAARLGANLNLGGNTLTLGDGTTGGLILLNGTTLSDSVGGASLAYGSGELLAYVDAANSATISAPLSGSGAFRKFGTGTLVLTHPSLPGTINPQAGTLSLSPASDVAFSGTLWGNGTVLKNGAGNLTWSDSSGALGGFWLRQGTVTVSAMAVTNLSTLITGPTSTGASPSSTLVLTNGSRWVQTSGGASIGRAANNYVITNHAMVVSGAHPVSGATSTLDLGNGALLINSRTNPSTSYSNSVTVAAGGLITNVAAITVGNGSGGTYGRLAVIGGGQVHCAGLTVGASQSYATTDVLDGSLLNLGGASLTVGTRGDTLVEGCQLTVDASIVTNVANITVGIAGQNSAYPTNNHAVVRNGGKLFSTGSVTVGTLNNSGGAIGALGNSIRVSGTGSFWNAGGGAVSVGPSSQGVTRENLLLVGNGAVATNAGTLWVGYAGAHGATENWLMVTNNGTLFSTGGVLIGRANPSTSQPRPSTFNGARVGGANSRWDLGGANMILGTATLAGYPTCTATCNWLRVESGGSVTSVGTLTVGSGVLVARNRLELAGGNLAAVSFVLSTDNVLAPVLTPQGLTAMAVSGTATLAAGSWIAPEALDGASGGTFTVLTASSVVDNGVALTPETDTALWSLQVTATEVKITRKLPATIVILR